MTQENRGDLRAEIAALRAETKTELRNINARLTALESTQRELVQVATTGKAGLRTLLWFGGLVTAGLTALAALWSAFSGN